MSPVIHKVPQILAVLVLFLSKVINPSGSLVEIYIVFMEQQLTPHGLQQLKQQPSPHGPPKQSSEHVAPKHLSKQHFSRQHSSPSTASWPKLRSLIVRRTVLWEQHPPPSTNMEGDPQQPIWVQLHWFISRTPVQQAYSGMEYQHVLAVLKSVISLYLTFSFPHPQRHQRNGPEVTNK